MGGDWAVAVASGELGDAAGMGCGVGEVAAMAGWSGVGEGSIREVGGATAMAGWGGLGELNQAMPRVKLNTAVTPRNQRSTASPAKLPPAGSVDAPARVASNRARPASLG